MDGTSLTVTGKIKFHIKNRKYFYILVGCVLISYIIPLCIFWMPKGHDIYFHMNRVDLLAQELEAGRFPARIYHGLFGGYGYASPLFYGDWLLYIPSFMVTLGVSVYHSYKFLIMLCAMASALSMYFCAGSVLKNKQSAFLTALVYSFSTYFISDLFVRHAIGELQAFIFIPIVFCGLHSIVAGDKKKWYLLSAGLCGVLVTHTLGAVLCVIFAVFFCLISVYNFIKDPKRLLWLCAAAALFFLLSASFIFPMLEQMNSGKFLSTDGTNNAIYGTLRDRSFPGILGILQLFSSTQLIVMKDYFIPAGIGGTMLLFVVWRFIRIKKIKFGGGDVFAILTVLAIIPLTRLFPWGMLQEYFGILQFPWRLHLLSSSFSAYAVGSYFKTSLVFKKNWILFLIAILFASFAFLNVIIPEYGSAALDLTDETAPEYKYFNAIGAGEYLPSGTDRKKMYNRGEKITSNYSGLDYSILREDGTTVVTYSGNNGEETYIDLPVILYKGYEAYLLSGGEEKQLELSFGENNVARVFVNGAREGVITVKYAGTPTQRISFIVTVISFTVLFAWLIFLKIKSFRVDPAPEVLTGV